MENKKELIFSIEDLNVEEELRNREIIKRNPKYLPIGSVVRLKTGGKKIMIMGYRPINLDNDKEEEYDYMGCLYPEGMIRSDINFLFNHEDIKKILAKGLIDDEVKYLLEKI